MNKKSHKKELKSANLPDGTSRTRLSSLKNRKALEAKVKAGTKKAIREYRETFRILANYDRS